MICGRFIGWVCENAVMACVICMSRWEASHCIACVNASTSMVRLVGRTVFEYRPPALLASENPNQSLVTINFTIYACDQLRRPSRSRCHVVCCWLRRSFVLLHWISSLPLRLRQCVHRFSDSRVSSLVGLELNWTFFPVPYLLALREAVHSLGWIDCFTGPIKNLPLASLHPFSFLTGSGGGGGGGGVGEWGWWILGILHHIEVSFDLLPLNCSLFPLVAGPADSAWPQWVWQLLFA